MFGKAAEAFKKRSAEAAEALEGHVKEMRDNTMEIQQAMAEKVTKDLDKAKKALVELDSRIQEESVAATTKDSDPEDLAVRADVPSTQEDGASPQDLVRLKIKAAEARLDAEDAKIAASQAREEVLSIRAELELSKAWCADEVQKAYAQAEEALSAKAAAEKQASQEAGAVSELSELRKQVQKLEAAAVETQQSFDTSFAEAKAEAARLREEALRKATAGQAQSASESNAVLEGLSAELERLKEDEVLHAQREETSAAKLHAASQNASRQQAELEVTKAKAEEAAQKAAEAAEAAAAEVQAVREQLLRLRQERERDAKRADASESSAGQLRAELEQLHQKAAPMQQGGIDAASAMTEARECRQQAAESEAALKEAEMENRRLENKIMYFQAHIKTLAAADAQGREDDPLGPVAALVGKANNGEDGAPNGECEDIESALLRKDGSAPAAVSSPEELCEKLQAKLAEMETQNKALRRQVEARPIVFQFGDDPEDEDGAEDDGDIASENATAEAGDAQVGVPEQPQPNLRAATWAAASKGRRKVTRVMTMLRRERHLKVVEKSLRAFTHLLLHRPLLMWLFYAQLFAVWMVEFWRQARSQPLASDPASGIEATLQAFSNAGVTGSG